MTLHQSVRRQFGLPLIGIDAPTADKGKDVFRAGRVQWVREGDDTTAARNGNDSWAASAQRGWRLRAAVSGSGGESYRTTVDLARHADSLQASADCTCPAPKPCKHAAAALLAWLAQEARDDVPGAATADPQGDGAGQRSRALFQRQHALHWARELAAVRLAGSDEAAGLHLCYVLLVQDRAAQLAVYRMRRLKGGGLAQPERYPGFVDQAFSPPAFWDDLDASVAVAMLQETRGSGSSFSLGGSRAGEALLALAGARRLYLDQPPDTADRHALAAGPEVPARIEWLPQAGAAGGSGEPPLRLGIEVPPPKLVIYCPMPCYLDRPAGTLGPLSLQQPTSRSMMRWLREAPAVTPEAAPEVAIALHGVFRARPRLQPAVPELPAHPVRESRERPRFVLGLFTTGSAPPPRNRQGRAPNGRPFMAISMAVEYAGQRIEPLRLSTLGVQSAGGPLLVVCDRGAEQVALAELREAIVDVARGEPGLSLAATAGRSGTAGGASSGWLTVAALPADGVAAARIKHELAAAYAARGWIVVDQSELASEVVAADDVVVTLQPVASTTGAQGSDRAVEGSAGSDWFELQSGIQVGSRRIDLAPLLASILAAGGFDAWRSSQCPQGVFWMKVSEREVLRLEAQRIEPLARVVADWARLRGDDEPDVLLEPFAAAQLAAAAGVGSLPETVSRLRELFEKFDGLKPVQAPASFNARLRPYQQDGLAWLQFLAQAGLGGILADDMGLGKTVQVLAHIDLERSAGRLSDPVLVVAPTSVIFNWQAEAQSHAPSLRVLALTGLGRSRRFADIGGHDVVLTSYALLPRDAAVLRQQRWHAVILDEAQMIKNPRTLGAAVVRDLPAGHRFALTGTPLENHLGELWSIMQFVLPGLLGPDESFRRRFRGPIERQPGTEVASERLRALESRVRPFMLRRTKQSVLADLPPRTEIIQRIELPSEQRDLYESIRAAMDKRVREALSHAGLARSQIVLLDALLKLRQACCDPALVKLPGARRVTRSAKRDALIELLATLVDEGRKALVFSQFTSMLDLIEAAIDADPRLAGVARSRLDGDTSDRGGAVEQFQQGEAQLFLLSLKAGGVGLNLTAADTVIHYDPWWNPAVENQATDRAHRIGQEKPVFVQKRIAAGTVEERILALQSRKAELAAAVLSGSLAAGGKALSQEDLLGLFEPL